LPFSEGREPIRRKNCAPQPRMRVLVICLGTRGDVEPMLAAAKALQRRGHAVTLCGPDNCARWVRDEHGVAFAALGLDFKELLASRAVREAPSLERAIGGAVAEAMPRVLAAAAAAAAAIAHTGGLDLVLTSATFTGGADLAEVHGAALVTAALAPVWATSEFPFFMWPLPAMQCLNRASYSIPSFARLIDAPHLRRWRRETLGLASDGPRLIEMGRRTSDGSVAPRLCCVSPSVVPQPADWDALTTMAGYWRLDDPADWTPDAALVAFLAGAAAAQPPTPVVYIGFGSMTRLEPRALAQVVGPAVRLAGVRAVLALGWSGSLADAGVSSDDVHLLEAAPHAKLFPLLSAVVHHGGAGTTAAGLSAGRPTLVCPVGADQFMWGDRVHRQLGCGPAPVELAKLTTPLLAARLRELVCTPAYLVRATELAKKIAGEDGLALAVQVIEGEGKRQGKL
jgi:sterol 3beta-glucosyltransferase